MYPTQHQTRIKRQLIIAGIIVALLIVILGLTTLKHSNSFHIVKTDPKLSSISVNTAYVTVYFSEPAIGSSLSFTDNSHIIDSKSFRDNYLKMNLRQNLSVNHKYTVTINYLKGKDGKVIRSKDLTFTTSNTPFTSQPKAQQQASIAQQDEQLYEVDNIDYRNFDALLDYGITSGQENNIKNLIFDYSNIVKQQFRLVIIDPTTIAVTTHDPNGDDTTDKADFTVSLANQPYKAHAEYDALYDSVHLTLANSSGTQVYDSANGND